MSEGDNLYRRNGVWYGMVQVAGKEYRRSLRTRSRTEAKRERDRWVEKLQAQARGGAGRHTWPEAVLKYTEEVLDGGSVKPNTAKRYKVSLRQTYAFFSPLDIEAIGDKEIADYVSTRIKAKTNNATIRRDLTAISRVFAASKTWGWGIKHNPAKEYDRSFVRERRDPIREPSAEEIEARIQKAPKEIADVLRFLWGTGMRENEATTLEWSEVNLVRGEITLLRTKTNCPRVIRIEDCEKWVSAQLAGAKKTHDKGLVFRKRPNGLLKAIRSGAC